MSMIGTLFGKPIKPEEARSALEQYAPGTAITATELQMRQSEAMRNAMMNQAQMPPKIWHNAALGKSYADIVKDPKQMYFTLRQISNGFMVLVDDEEIYVAELNDVGTAITTHWVSKRLGV